MTNYERTMQVAEEHFCTEDYFYAAKMIGEEKGFIAKKLSGDHSHYIICRIEEESKHAVFEIYSSAVCEAPYRDMTAGYLADVNAVHKLINFRMDRDGQIFAHFYLSFENAAITPKMFDDHIESALDASEIFIEPFEKVCHGKRLSFKDEPVHVIADKAMRDRLNRMPPIGGKLRPIDFPPIKAPVFDEESEERALDVFRDHAAERKTKRSILDDDDDFLLEDDAELNELIKEACALSDEIESEE